MIKEQVKPNFSNLLIEPSQQIIKSDFFNNDKG